MNLDNLFPEQPWTTAELHELADYLTKPVVRKYFKSLQINSFKDIANGLPKPGESDAEYLRRQAIVAGSLQAIEQLLEIKKPA
jgi:hypothetical protein